MRPEDRHLAHRLQEQEKAAAAAAEAALPRPTPPLTRPPPPPPHAPLPVNNAPVRWIAGLPPPGRAPLDARALAEAAAAAAAEAAKQQLKLKELKEDQEAFGYGALADAAANDDANDNEDEVFIQYGVFELGIR